MRHKKKLAISFLCAHINASTHLVWGVVHHPSNRACFLSTPLIRHVWQDVENRSHHVAQHLEDFPPFWNIGGNWADATALNPFMMARWKQIIQLASIMRILHFLFKVKLSDKIQRKKIACLRQWMQIHHAHTALPIQGQIIRWNPEKKNGLPTTMNANPNAMRPMLHSWSQKFKVYRWEYMYTEKV